MFSPGNLVSLVSVLVRAGSAAHAAYKSPIKNNYYKALVQSVTGERNDKNQTPEQKFVSFMVWSRIALTEQDFSEFVLTNQQAIFKCFVEGRNPMNVAMLLKSNLELANVDKQFQARFEHVQNNASYQDFCDAYDIMKSKDYTSDDISIVTNDIRNRNFSERTDAESEKQEIDSQIAQTGKAKQKQRVNQASFQDNVNLMFRRINKVDTKDTEPDKESNVEKSCKTAKIDTRPMAVRMNGKILHITTREIKSRMIAYNQIMSQNEAATKGIKEKTKALTPAITEREVADAVKNATALNASLLSYQKTKKELTSEIENDPYFQENYTAGKTQNHEYAAFKKENTAHVFAVLCLYEDNPNNPLLKKGMSIERMITIGKMNGYFDPKRREANNLLLNSTDVKVIEEFIFSKMGNNPESQKLVKTIRELMLLNPNKSLGYVIGQYLSKTNAASEKSIEVLFEHCEATATKKEYLQEMEKSAAALESYFFAQLEYNEKVVEIVGPNRDRGESLSGVDAQAAQLQGQINNFKNIRAGRAVDVYDEPEEKANAKKKTDKMQNKEASTKDKFEAKPNNKRMIVFASTLEERLTEKSQTGIGGTSKEKSIAVTGSFPEIISIIQDRMLLPIQEAQYQDNSKIKELNSLIFKLRSNVENIENNIQNYKNNIAIQDQEMIRLGKVIFILENDIKDNITKLKDSGMELRNFDSFLTSIRKMGENELTEKIEQSEKFIMLNRDRLDPKTLRAYELQLQILLDMRQLSRERENIWKGSTLIEGYQGEIELMEQALHEQRENLLVKEEELSQYSGNNENMERAVEDICIQLNNARMDKNGDIKETDKEFATQQKLFREFYESLADFPNGDDLQAYMSAYVETHICPPETPENRKIQLTGSPALGNKKSSKMTKQPDSPSSSSSSHPNIVQAQTADQLIRQKDNLQEDVATLVEKKSGVFKSPDPVKMLFLQQADDFLSNRSTDIELMRRQIKACQEKLNISDAQMHVADKSDDRTVAILKQLNDHVDSFDKSNETDRDHYNADAIIKQRKALLDDATKLGNKDTAIAGLTTKDKNFHQAKIAFVAAAKKYLENPQENIAEFKLAMQAFKLAEQTSKSGSSAKNMPEPQSEDNSRVKKLYNNLEKHIEDAAALHGADKLKYNATIAPKEISIANLSKR